MTTKKNLFSESLSEIKASKANQKSTKSSPSTQSPQESIIGCCHSAQETSRLHDHHLEEHKSPKLSVTSFKTECCKGTSNCGSLDQNAQKHETVLPAKTEAKKGPKTRIVIRYDVGFHNTLSLRGKGANLSWDKGFLLKNIKPDEWVWETETLFNTCEFKVLINDHHYEIGENHPLSCGASIQYTPKF